MAFDPFGDTVGVALGAGEDDDGLVAALVEERQQQVVLLEDIDRVDRVVDGVGRAEATVTGSRSAQPAMRPMASEIVAEKSSVWRSFGQ
jgi:hypothetical protein